jgi:RNA polymerase sigma factor (sigma-70 family)
MKKELTDADLLERVAGRERDPRAAHEAEGELYGRHVRYLYGVLSSRQQRMLSLASTSAEDLVQDTFRRAFERAHTFTTDGISDPEQLRRRTRAWLGRIAQNLLADTLERVREVSATPYVERVSCDEIDAPPPSSPELRMMREALGELSDREQDVLRVTALYFRAGEHQRLPNAVSAELADRWSTSSENVRAIRSRAMKKLKEILSARGATRKDAR